MCIDTQLSLTNKDVYFSSMWLSLSKSKSIVNKLGHLNEKMIFLLIVSGPLLYTCSSSIIDTHMNLSMWDSKNNSSSSEEPIPRC